MNEWNFFRFTLNNSLLIHILSVLQPFQNENYSFHLKDKSSEGNIDFQVTNGSYVPKEKEGKTYKIFKDILDEVIT